MPMLLRLPLMLLELLLRGGASALKDLLRLLAGGAGDERPYVPSPEAEAEAAAAASARRDAERLAAAEAAARRPAARPGAARAAHPADADPAGRARAGARARARVGGGRAGRLVRARATIPARRSRCRRRGPATTSTPPPR